MRVSSRQCDGIRLAREQPAEYDAVAAQQRPGLASTAFSRDERALPGSVVSAVHRPAKLVRPCRRPGAFARCPDQRAQSREAIRGHETGRDERAERITQLVALSEQAVARS